MHGPAGDLLLYPPGKGFTGEAKILNVNIIMKMGFADCVLVQSFFLNAAYKKKKKKKRHTLLISPFETCG